MRFQIKPLERLGYILLLAGLFFLGTGALVKGWIDYLTLQNHGVTVEGIIIDRAATAKGDKQITYQFEAPGPDGTLQTYQQTHFVSRGYFTIPGDPVTIRYLPDDPETSNLAGNRFLLLGDLTWATIILALVEAFVLFLLILHLIDWRIDIQKQASHPL
ncbi:MAG: hypothetical protein H6636_02010 [Anaerolineales bacterium]|nr:hypothetical protein [Anaerolineales bacterium]